MEKPTGPSVLKSLALAFGDGLLFGVGVKLAQGRARPPERGGSGQGPPAERLTKVERRIEQSQTNGNGALPGPGEGLDGRVLEKVILALEARLAEHISGVERRLAETNAQVALELQGLQHHVTTRENSFAKSLQQAEAEMQDSLEAARQWDTDRITKLDDRLSALQEALPAKFREIVEAVRQSMEARLALALTELDNRAAARGVAPQQLQEMETQLRGELEGLAGRLATLRDELPPKIREIVEAVESAMETRIAAAQEKAAAQFDGIRQTIDGDLQRQTEQLSALDEKLMSLQEALPTRMAAEREAELEQLRQYSHTLEGRVEALERSLQSSSEEAANRAAERIWQAIESRLERRAETAQPAGPTRPVTDLWQKSTSAEQNVLDLIAGLGDLFGAPARPAAAPEPAAAPKPAVVLEPAAAPKPVAVPEPEAAPELVKTRAEVPPATAPEEPPQEEELAAEQSAAILFRPKEPSRKWRLPFLS